MRNVADETKLPLSEDEQLFAFPANPNPDDYLHALSELTGDARVLDECAGGVARLRHRPG